MYDILYLINKAKYHTVGTVPILWMVSSSWHVVSVVLILSQTRW